MTSHESVIYEESFPIECGTFEGVGRVSTRIKALLKEMNFAAEAVRRAAIVTYEAEMNACAYAEHGKIILRVTPEHITIEVIDEGQGIADIALAMREGFSTATEKMRHLGFGAGMGLSNIKNSSDSFHITSESGKGTRLEMVIRVNTNRDGT